MSRELIWKTSFIGALVALSLMILAPTFISKLPSWWPGEKIHLGLDLQGGIHLVLGIETEKAVETTLSQYAEDIKDSLAKKGIHLKGVKSDKVDTITISISSADDGVKAKTLLEEYSRIFSISETVKEEKPVVSLTMKEKEITEIKENAVNQGLETIRNRVDQFGVSEPTIQRSGDNRILIQLPGIKEIERAKNLIGKTALLEFKIVDDNADLDKALKGNVPRGDKIYYGKKEVGSSRKAYLIKKQTLLTGDSIVEALVRPDSYGSNYISIRFNNKGGRIFERITGANIKKRMAIVLDETVYSAPVIQDRISGGSAQITGRFTPEEAHDLAIILRAGSLPAPAKILYEEIVGPSLGADSIRQGLMSVAIAMVFVCTFMLIYYRVAGFVANFALFLNGVFLMAVLAALQATLTLPGIAGIILTVGMAVDANVLIYERIREELKLGKTPRYAIEGGYAKAFWTIFDANITTLIAAIILYQFGTGPIKGFAVTLFWGILISMLTAIFATKVAFEVYLAKRHIQVLSI